MDATTPKRDRIIQLFDAARVEGVAYLFVLIALGRFTVQELGDVCGDERHRIYRYMHRLESRGFAMRVQNGRNEIWYPTPLAVELFAGRIEVENLPRLPSSSNQISFDKASLATPEEEEKLRHKIYLNSQYGLTGPAAAALLTDPWITPLRLVAWMQQVGEMKRNGFPFRKSPEAYALACLQRHDEPNKNAYHLAYAVLDQYLRQLPGEKDGDETADPADDLTIADARQDLLAEAWQAIQRITAEIENEPVHTRRMELKIKFESKLKEYQRLQEENDA